MARLIYTGITSLDGYIADEEGTFDWAVPDEEVHAYINELEKPIGTYLYGRRMYELMKGWDSPESLPDQSAVTLEFARIWREADKIVYSTTLESAPTGRTRIERDFDPEVVREMKEHADGDLSVSGPELAAHAIREGLVDEWHMFIAPVIVGGGKPHFPGSSRQRLALLHEHRFSGGMVHLHYRTVHPAE